MFQILITRHYFELGFATLGCSEMSEKPVTISQCKCIINTGLAMNATPHVYQRSERFCRNITGCKEYLSKSALFSGIESVQIDLHVHTNNIQLTQVIKPTYQPLQRI